MHGFNHFVFNHFILKTSGPQPFCHQGLVLWRKYLQRPIVQRWGGGFGMIHAHISEKAMAPHSSVLAWRIPGMEEPGGLPSTGSHRVGQDWSNLAASAAASRGHIMHYRAIEWANLDWHVNFFTKFHICIYLHADGTV